MPDLSWRRRGCAADSPHDHPLLQLMPRLYRDDGSLKIVKEVKLEIHLSTSPPHSCQYGHTEERGSRGV